MAAASLPIATDWFERVRIDADLTLLTEPHVHPLVEMTDLREAQRSYEANITVISATRRMLQRTLDILKA